MADDKTGSGGNQMRVDSALVRELAELLSANDLTEIEVEDADLEPGAAEGGGHMHAGGGFPRSALLVADDDDMRHGAALSFAWAPVLMRAEPLGKGHEVAAAQSSCWFSQRTEGQSARPQQ